MKPLATIVAFFLLHAAALGQVKLIDVGRLETGSYVLTLRGDSYTIDYRIEEGTYLIAKRGESVTVDQAIILTSDGQQPAQRGAQTTAAAAVRSNTEIAMPPIMRAREPEPVGDSVVCRNVAMAFSIVLIRAGDGAYPSAAQIDAARRSAQNLASTNLANTPSDVVRKWESWGKETDDYFATVTRGRGATTEQYVANLTQMRDRLMAAANLPRLAVLKPTEVLVLVQELYPTSLAEQMNVVRQVMERFETGQE